MALAITILINAEVTAEVMMLSAKYNRQSTSNTPEAGTEIFSEDILGNGQMTPPQGMPDNGQMELPSDKSRKIDI